MPDTVAETCFAALFIDKAPLLDLRAPVEFARGALPGAVNLPLLDDEQRAAVGIRYRQSGNPAAVELGRQLVSGPLKSRRVAAWRDHLQAHPEALLYCYRGGLRSEIAQQWLQDEGVNVPRVAGGYKALRRYLLGIIDEVAASSRFIILAGRAGSGKTRLICTLESAVDLEACANHRGSAFGARSKPQPAPATFENRLAIEFLKLPARRELPIFLEDESRSIGSLSLPLELHRKMFAAPVAIIDEPLESRVETIVRDYIEANYRELRKANPASCDACFAAFLRTALAKIRRRLGGVNYAAVRALMDDALAQPRMQDSLVLHRRWIHKLLMDYYDPMYDYQLQRRPRQVLFRGSRIEIGQWAADRPQPARRSCP